MRRPIKVEALSGYRLRLTYPDGVEGVVDLAGDVGRGVFTPLADAAFFRTVHIGQFRQIAWSEDIEICPDAAYREITRTAATAFVRRLELSQEKDARASLRRLLR